MNGQNSNSQNFRFDWDTDGGLLVIVIMMIIIIGVAIACSLWIVNTGKIDHTGNENGIVLDRRYDELNRKLQENRLLIAETQATLQFLMRGLTIIVEPKEQTGPAATPAPSDGQIAPKAP